MAEKQDATPRRPRKRAAAEPPAAGTGGIEDDLQARATAAAHQAEQMKAGETVSTGAGAAGQTPAQDLVPTQPQQKTAATKGIPSQPAVPEETAETLQDHGAEMATADDTPNHEIQNSGQTSGKPENQKSGNQESGSDGASASTAAPGPADYLGMVYEGIIDPYDDFRKTSTQLPPVVSRTLKAAAPIHGISVQQLLRDIVLGRVKPLPESHPDLLDRFYRMAKQGKLK